MSTSRDGILIGFSEAMHIRLEHTLNALLAVKDLALGRTPSAFFVVSVLEGQS